VQGQGQWTSSSSGSNGAAHSADSEGLKYYKPFEFLSLGLMAYIGNDKAVTQLEAGKTNVQLADYPAFLLWRSVYITKQVSFRNRVLILFDWLKARVFGRDISLF
jgi:NADH:ubiquinone reductase (non-electrogenic)